MSVVNYAKEGDAEIERIKAAGLRPRLLLHSCCAPCSTRCIRLLAEVFDVAVYYFDPNIFPEAEYAKRAEEQRRYLAAEYPQIECVVADYDHASFLKAVKGLETEPEGGARCAVCFEQRLAATAEYAKAHGFEMFATTLTVSPHKDSQTINEIGLRIAREKGVTWFPYDFKKHDGYGISVRLSKEFGLYRQNYCGCEFALFAQRAAQNSIS